MDVIIRFQRLEELDLKGAGIRGRSYQLIISTRGEITTVVAATGLRVTHEQNRNGLFIEVQPFGHGIVQNVVGGITIGHMNAGLEFHRVTNAGIIAVAKSIAFVNFLFDSGLAVLLSDYCVRVGSTNGAESTLVQVDQVGNHQIPAEGQIAKCKSNAGSLGRAIFLDIIGSIFSIFTGTVCNLLNSSAIILRIGIDPGNSTGFFV